MTAVIILAALQFLDAWTTLRVLKEGGRELNPIMRDLFDLLGVEAALIVKGIAVVAVGYACIGYQMAWLTWALCVWYSLVVAWNIRQMR